MRCSLCGGPRVLLGKLGVNKVHRCRNCSYVFVAVPKPKPGRKEEGNAEDVKGA